MVSASHHYLRCEAQTGVLSIRAISANDGAQFDSVSFAPKPVLSSQPLLDSAAYTTGVAGNGLASIFGRDLAFQQGVPIDRSATEFAGTSVTIGSRAVPLLFVSPTQLNVQIPSDLAGDRTLQVTTPNGTAEATIRIADIAPRLFSQPGTIDALALHANGSLISSASPARSGESVTVFATGIGRGDSSLQVSLRDATLAPTSTVQTPGLAGVYQISFQVPRWDSTSVCGIWITQNGVTGNRLQMVVQGLDRP
jgi:uncharacterized protein (TIGR03437 family)